MLFLSRDLWEAEKSENIFFFMATLLSTILCQPQTKDIATSYPHHISVLDRSLALKYFAPIIN